MKKQRNGYALDSQDVAFIKQIYKQIWDEVGEANGLPVLWFAVFQDFLKHKGYEIRKKAPASGDVSTPEPK